MVNVLCCILPSTKAETDNYSSLFDLFTMKHFVSLSYAAVRRWFITYWVSFCQKIISLLVAVLLILRGFFTLSVFLFCASFFQSWLKNRHSFS